MSRLDLGSSEGKAAMGGNGGGDVKMQDELLRKSYTASEIRHLKSQVRDLMVSFLVGAGNWRLVERSGRQ